jgi:hypothetical protein
MKSFNEFVENKTVNYLFSRMFAARDEAHILHLSSKSYAEHTALGDFYDKLIELTDEIIETYQGKYGLIKIEHNSDDKFDSAKEFLDDFTKTLVDSRELLEDDEHLANILDEITGLAYRTLYKIRFLK